MLCRCVALFVMMVGLTGTALAADWPQWRGPNRDAKSTETGLLKTWPKDGPKLLWKVESLADVGTGYGAVAVVGDKVYLVGAADESKEATEYVSCISTKDGKTIWRKPLGTSPGSFQLQGWGRGPRSTPTVDGDHLYVLGVMGDLSCMKTDGTMVWHKNLKKDFNGEIPKWGYSESPLVDGDQVVCVPGGKGGMISLNKKTGATTWQCTEFAHETGYASIMITTVGGVKQYVTQTGLKGIGVRTKDGKLLWETSDKGRKTAVIPTPVILDNYVFFTAGYGYGCECYKLEADGMGTKATKVYANKTLANHHGGVIELGGNIFGHSDTGKWICLDLKAESDPLWTSTKLGKGSITYADGSFYCYGEDKGEIVKIAAGTEGWNEQGRFTIPKKSATRPGSGKFWPHPVIANGKLFIRDYEDLYCYDISQPSS